MTKMTPLLVRNERFARTYTPTALGLPKAPVLIVTCLDHRVDPSACSARRCCQPR
jgi:carbonic anhydrase